MALAKEDLQKIKGVVHGEVENLAHIIAKGFEGVDKRFEQVDKRFDKLEVEVAHISATFIMMQRDLEEIGKAFVRRDELQDVLARLRLVEQKLGIQSGKD
ncbi:MAG: hypothetical protein Q8Q41_00520 [bacterium]|nr:hypothetical protein [bacterium]